MKIEKSKVLEYLKPKVKALGFKKDIIEGIAADIADNLEEVADDASEDDVNATIKPAVDAVIPSLKLAQRLTNQGIEEYRKKQEDVNEQLKKELEQYKKENSPKERQEVENKSVESPALNNPVKAEEHSKEKPLDEHSPKKETETTPEWVKQLIESNKAQMEQQKAQMEQQKKLIDTLTAEVNGIKLKDTTAKRRAVLDDLLKDTGTFGKRTIKNYERMKFETDEDFDSFVSEIKEDLEQLNQERANEGLAKFGAPKVELATGTEPPKPKPLSETELEELASLM